MMTDHMEPLIARLTRLGVLQRACDGQTLAWNDDFRTVVGVSTPSRSRAFQVVRSTGDGTVVRTWSATEAATVHAVRLNQRSQSGWLLDRPSAAALVAGLSLGQYGEIAYHQLDLPEFLRDAGFVDEVDVTPVTGDVWVRLSPAYRRMVNSGREPDLQAGFEAVRPDGGPLAIRTCLEAESSKMRSTGQGDNTPSQGERQDDQPIAGVDMGCSSRGTHGEA